MSASAVSVTRVPADEAAGVAKFPANMLAYFPDVAIQHGIKCGLAAILAWWVAQVIRLPNPTWALITVFVLALSPFVGSMGEKGILRMVGTLVGGFLGMLLVGNFANNIVIVLGGTFFILTVCTWLFGWNRFPYAFFLCALTTNVVVSGGLANPDQSWSIALHRFLEVSIGVGATLLVNSLLWPRYARFEFKDKFSASLDDIRILFADTVGARPADEQTIKRIEQSFVATLTAMRLLMRFGAAESLPFRQRIPVYMQLIPELSLLFFTVFAIRRSGGSGKIENAEFRDLTSEIEQKILKVWDHLVGGAPDVALREEQAIASEIARAQQQMEAWIAASGSGSPEWQPASGLVAASALLVALEDLHVHILRIARGLLDLEVPPVGGKTSVDLYSWSPRLRSYWMHSAIKGSIAACIALAFCDWLQPPGADLIPLGAWVIVVLSRGYVQGEGDRRSFHYMAWTTVFMIGLCLVALLVAAPMASYAVTNVFMFLALFLFGYLAIAKGGITYPMQIWLLASVSLFGLNAQEPVVFQSFVGLFFGIVISCLIGSLVQRLIWPLIPAHELKSAVVEFLGACRDFRTAQDPEKYLLLRVIIATTPAEMVAWAKRLDTPDVPKGEGEKWTAFIDSLREMGARLRALNRLFQDPAMVALVEKIRAPLQREHDRLSARYETLITAFESRSTESLRSQQPLVGLTSFVHECRERLPSDALSPAEVSQLLGLAQRWAALELALDDSRKRAADLSLAKYFGDYAL